MNLQFPFDLAECHQGNEQTWYDSGLISCFPANNGRRFGSFQSSGNLQSFVCTRTLQRNQKRTGCNSTKISIKQRRSDGEFLFNVFNVQRGCYNIGRCW